MTAVSGGGGGMRRQVLTDNPRRWFALDRARRFRGTGGEDLYLTAGGRWVLHSRRARRWAEIPDSAATVWLDICGYQAAADKIRTRLARQAAGLARAFDSRPWMKRSLGKEEGA